MKGSRSEDLVKLQVVHKGPNCRKDHRHCQTWPYQRGLIMGIRIRQGLHVVVAPFQILSKRLGPSCHPAQQASTKLGNLSTVARNLDLSTLQILTNVKSSLLSYSTSGAFDALLSRRLKHEALFGSQTFLKL